MRLVRLLPALALAGCSTLMVARPPPRLAATDVTPTPEGHARVAAVLAGTATPGDGLAPDRLDGPVQVRAGAGLAERLDLSLSLGIATVGGLVGYRLAGGRVAEVGAIAGLGLALNPAEDDEGSWWFGSVSPGAGLRGAIHLSDALDLPLAFRVSRALVVPGPGAPASARPVNWTPAETWAGASWAPAAGMRLDAGLGALFVGPPYAAASVMLQPTFAFTVDLDGRRAAGGGAP